MSFAQNYGTHDPKLPEQDEIEEYMDSQIIINGELTPYGEGLYFQANRTMVYDEVQGEWIYV